jgi:hypothetical protein
MPSTHLTATSELTTYAVLIESSLLDFLISMLLCRTEGADDVEILVPADLMWEFAVKCREFKRS